MNEENEADGGAMPRAPRGTVPKSAATAKRHQHAGRAGPDHTRAPLNERRH